MPDINDPMTQHAGPVEVGYWDNRKAKFQEELHKGFEQGFGKENMRLINSQGSNKKRTTPSTAKKSKPAKKAEKPNDEGTDKTEGKPKKEAGSDFAARMKAAREAKQKSKGKK
jgi:hypothetical protein